MIEVIEELTVKLFEAEKTVKRYSDAIKGLRAVCEHRPVYQGSGHKDSYYRCEKCGKEWSE